MVIATGTALGLTNKSSSSKLWGHFHFLAQRLIKVFVLLVLTDNCLSQC